MADMTNELLTKLLDENPGARQLYNGGDAIAYLMADHTAAAFLGISRATFWRRVADGTFPKPIKIGGATRWRRSDLIDAIDRAAESTTA